MYNKVNLRAILLYATTYGNMGSKGSGVLLSALNGEHLNEEDHKHIAWIQQWFKAQGTPNGLVECMSLARDIEARRQ